MARNDSTFAIFGALRPFLRRKSQIWRCVLGHNCSGSCLRRYAPTKYPFVAPNHTSNFLLDYWQLLRISLSTPLPFVDWQLQSHQSTWVWSPQHYPRSPSSVWSTLQACEATLRPQMPLLCAFCVDHANLEGHNSHPLIHLQHHRHLPCYLQVWRVQSWVRQELLQQLSLSCLFYYFTQRFAAKRLTWWSLLCYQLWERAVFH